MERRPVDPLDDIQWIDRSSLHILCALVASKSSTGSGLLVVGTCRGNEVDKDDLLSVRLRELEQKGTTNITDIQVSNLTASAVACMIADALGSYYSETLPLAEIISGHTGGNAFFVKQCLKTLVDRDVLQHNADRWTWDQAALETALPPFNANLVIPFLATKLQSCLEMLLS